VWPSPPSLLRTLPQRHHTAAGALIPVEEAPIPEAELSIWEAADPIPEVELSIWVVVGLIREAAVSIWVVGDFILAVLSTASLDILDALSPAIRDMLLLGILGTLSLAMRDMGSRDMGSRDVASLNTLDTSARRPIPDTELRVTLFTVMPGIWPTAGVSAVLAMGMGLRSTDIPIWRTG
jgi:hypothetical protein